MVVPRRTPPMRYEFLVSGELTDRALAAFPEFTPSALTSWGNGHAHTALGGLVADDSHLRGVLARFDTLGLTVVEMRRIAP